MLNSENMQQKQLREKFSKLSFLIICDNVITTEGTYMFVSYIKC